MPDCLQSFLFRAAQHESELSLGQFISWHVTMVAGMPGEFRDTKHLECFFIPWTCREATTSRALVRGTC